MRTGHDDLGCFGLLQRLRVFHGELLEDEFVPGAPGRITSTCLAVSEHGIVHARNVQQLRDCTCGLLGSIFVGTGAADPEQVLHLAEVLDVFTHHWYWKRKILGPIHSTSWAHAPWISPAFQAFE